MSALRLVTLLMVFMSAISQIALSTAAGQALAPVPESDRQMVEQKATLVARLLTDSPLAQRVVASPNKVAKTYLHNAENLYKRSRTALEKNDVANADRLLNDAMRQITRARDLVPETNSVDGSARTHYLQLMDSVETLEQSYARNVERRSAWLAEVGDEDLKRVKLLADRAKQLAASGQLGEANIVLARARRDMLRSYENLLGAAPIVYDLKFSSPDEEFNFELNRHRDYERLVAVAIEEFKPSAEAIAEIERLREESKKFSASASHQAANKDTVTAINTKRNATIALQRALEIAGVVVPQRMPN